MPSMITMSKNCNPDVNQAVFNNTDVETSVLVAWYTIPDDKPRDVNTLNTVAFTNTNVKIPSPSGPVNFEINKVNKN